jgi:hypothetical protein
MSQTYLTRQDNAYLFIETCILSRNRTDVEIPKLENKVS